MVLMALCKMLQLTLVFSSNVNNNLNIYQSSDSEASSSLVSTGGTSSFSSSMSSSNSSSSNSGTINSPGSNGGPNSGSSGTVINNVNVSASGTTHGNIQTKARWLYSVKPYAKQFQSMIKIIKFIILTILLQCCAGNYPNVVVNGKVADQADKRPI